MSLNRIGLLLGPLAMIILILLPAPAPLSPEAWKVVAMGALMLIWWVTEAVPLAVTALIPLAFLPLMGISDMKTAATPYSNPVVFLFMGGFMLALAMEKWNLHRRIALGIVSFTGTNANGIILGFMLATAFISMWISNTATAVMMLPIGLSVIKLLTGDQGDKYPVQGIQYFAIAIMLVIAYGSSIGGMATIIGTPPNVVFKGFMQETYGYEISFSRWLAIGLPVSLLMLVGCYFLIVKILYPNRLGRFEGATELITAEKAKLGGMNKGERLTLYVFIGAALFWILQAPINHWLGGTIKITDEIIAILATLVLFLLPSGLSKTVLEWRDTEKLPWGILLLFGGGLSLADALEDTGVVGLIGQLFAGSTHADFWMILGLVAISVLLTEVMSNVAQVTIVLPVIGAVAQGAGLDPLLLCLPATLAASAGFMLPMSTPPNAIVFASGHISIKQMVKAGFWLNLIAILLVSFISAFILPLFIG